MNDSRFTVVERLTENLLSGDLRAAERTLRDSRLAGPLMLDELLAPAMHEVGDLWASHQITTADEHLASTTAHRLLTDFAPTLVRAPANSRPRILLAAARRERHTLGAMMAAEVLRGDGYEVQLIEGGVPHEDLIAFASAHPPRIVGISVGMPEAADVAHLYSGLVAALPGVGILFGGRTAGTVVPELAGHDPLARIAAKVADASRLADELIEAQSAGAVRAQASSAAAAD